MEIFIICLGGAKNKKIILAKNKMNKNFSPEGFDFKKEEDAVKWYREKFENAHLSRRDKEFLDLYTDPNEEINDIINDYLIEFRGEFLDESHPLYKEYNEDLKDKYGDYVTLMEIHDYIEKLDKIIENSRLPETLIVHDYSKISPYCPSYKKIRNENGQIDLKTVENIWKKSNSTCKFPEFFHGYISPVGVKKDPVTHQLIAHKGQHGIYHYNSKSKKSFLILGRNNVTELGKMKVIRKVNTGNLEYLKIYSTFTNFN